MFQTTLTIPKPILEAAEKWEQYSIEDFSGGLNTAEPSASLRKDQFSALSNYYHQPNRTLKVRGPFRPWLVASEDTILPDSAPPLTFTIVELRGTDYVVASWDNGSNYEVSVYDETNNRWAGEVAGTSIKTNLTEGYKVRFAKFSINEAEDLIFCNGKDTPQRWVGTVDTASSDLGLAAPADTTTLATANTAVTDEQGITLDGKYYYKFTAFYDSQGTNTKYGESGPTAYDDITVAGCDVSGDIRVSAALTNCPDIPSGATKNYVYRSPPEESNGPYRRVGYYTSGNGFTDNTPVGEEGLEAPLDAGTPPKLKNPLVSNGRLWGIGLNAAGALANKLVYSSSGEPDMFPALNYAYFPDPLCGPKEFKKDVYVFTKKQIYVFPGGDVDTYPDGLKICEVGCDSFDSIVDVGTGLVWQYEGNIYWSNFNLYNPVSGDLPWPIGDSIRDKIDGISVGYRDNSAGEFYRGRYYLSYTGSNQTVNSATIVWDVKTGMRFLPQYFTGGWTSVDWKANDLKVFDGVLYTADNTNKYVMEHDFVGAADYTSKTNYDASTDVDIPTEVTTGDLHFGHEQTKKLINSLSIVAKSSGITYETTTFFDGEDFSRTKQFVLGSSSVAVDSTWLIWGQGTWDNFNWGSSPAAFQSGHKKIGKGGKGRNVKLKLESINSQDTNLIALKLYYKSLPEPA